MFLNWWVKSAGYAAQKWVAGLNTAKETTSTKNVILNAFLMRDFYFKRRGWKLLSLLSDHLTQMQSKERKSAWEKHAVPIQYLRSDEVLTGLMSVSLLYRYFRKVKKQFWTLADYVFLKYWQKKLLTAALNKQLLIRLEAWLRIEFV